MEDSSRRGYDIHSLVDGRPKGVTIACTIPRPPDSTAIDDNRGLIRRMLDALLIMVGLRRSFRDRLND